MHFFLLVAVRSSVLCLLVVPLLWRHRVNRECGARGNRTWLPHCTEAAGMALMCRLECFSNALLPHSPHAPAAFAINET